MQQLHLVGVTTDHDSLIFSVRKGAKSGSFVLSLDEDGLAASTTDCNQMSGGYVKDEEVLSFKPFAMTKMYCEGSQEGVYAQQLAQIGHILSRALV